MKLYDIFNPCDPMTMYAPSLLVAGVAVALLGNGKLGVDGTPMIIGWDKWFSVHGINDLASWIKSNSKDVSAALRSVALGSEYARPAYDAAIAAIDCPVKRAAFIKERNDRMRSSTSDFESYAHELADRIDKINEGEDV